MSLVLGMERDAELPTIVRDELDQIIAAIQTQFNKLGAVVDVPTDAAAFSGSGAMTWTVEARDQAVSYAIVNNMMLLNVRIDNSSVGGTPTQFLRMRLPAGFIVARSASGPCLLYDNAATAVLGQMRALVGSTLVEFIRFDGGVFTASTNNTSVVGQLQIPVLVTV